MPKYNPKRKVKSQRQGEDSQSSSTSAPAKKKGSYSRRSSALTKFYGLIIIVSIITGIVFLVNNLSENHPPDIEQWDHVQLYLEIWISDADVPWDETKPNYTWTEWYNFTTIYEPSTDTNETVNTDGLPLGIYEKVPEHSVGVKSDAFMILNCIDLDKDKKDDHTGQRANGWGFPESHQFWNKTIIVKFEILDFHKVVKGMVL